MPDSTQTWRRACTMNQSFTDTHTDWSRKSWAACRYPAA